jgi:DNA transformation protein
VSRVPEFVAWVVERLEPLGPLRTRALFGGHGLWLDDAVGEDPSARGKGLFFALFADDVLYLKADDETRTFFTGQGLEPFRPFDGDTVMDYYPVPDEVLEHPERLLAWANRALGAALRSRAGRGVSRRAPASRRGRRGAPGSRSGRSAR